MSRASQQANINATFSAWDRLTTYIHSTVPAHTRALITYTGLLRGRRGY